MTQQLGINVIGKFAHRNIFAGDFPRATEPVQLAAGRSYPMGAVLGKNTVTGLCSLSNSAASDGTEIIFGILTQDIDATDADVAEGQAAVVYLTGQFVGDKLTFGGADTWQSRWADARALSIFFRDAVYNGVTEA